MTETKRDVFDEVRYKFRNFKNEHRHGMYASPDSIDHYLSDALKRYDAALPDDLPVIPKVWGDTIEEFKANHYRLSEIFTEWAWNYDEQELISRAYLLGVWRVEETGEIVKLEEEK